MKFLLAPDSYKECLSALEVAYAMEAGIMSVSPDAEVVKLPIADGGEGTLIAIHNAIGGELIAIDSVNVNNEPIVAQYLIIDDTAYIEVAQTVGLEQIPKKARNIADATSYGVGLLIKDALAKEIFKFVIGLGGSACNDGGAGLLQALDFQLLDETNKPIQLGNRALATLTNFKKNTDITTNTKIEITIASDVTNPLCGKNGCTYTYGRQKGATGENMAEFDRNISYFANVITENKYFDFSNTSASGAAGGIGFGLMQLSENFSVKSGIGVILDVIGFDNIVKTADIVITGEGATDNQTAFGKAPIGVTKRALAYNVPTIVLSGSVADDVSELYKAGVLAIFNASHKIETLSEALQNARENITHQMIAITKILVQIKK
jgi:glycerate kinase